MIFFNILKRLYKKNINDLNLEKEDLINSNVEKLLVNYKYDASKKDEFQSYLKYIEYSKNCILLNKIKTSNFNNPKISIVISMYNREQYIKSVVRSIQNQNFADIEIIIVNDYSTDNSSKYVKEYQKEDPRIILLENKENMGTLYSKSIEVLYAKGHIYNLLIVMICFVIRTIYLIRIKRQ